MIRGVREHVLTACQFYLELPSFAALTKDGLTWRWLHYREFSTSFSTDDDGVWKELPRLRKLLYRSAMTPHLFITPLGIFTGPTRWLATTIILLLSVFNASYANTPDTDYVWPSGAPTRVLTAFDPPKERWNSGHRGVDLELTAGDTVYAAGTGTVVYAGNLAGRGLVSIEHEGGLRTTYEPVTATVAKGSAVKAGEPIGTLEAGHLLGKDALHWGAKFPADQYINPLSLLTWSHIRLWK